MQNGKFEVISEDKDHELKEKKLYKTFVNYFSFGIDGKVGYSFDRHRANSKCGNLIVYGAIGIAKSLTRTKTVDELIESSSVSPNAEDEKQHQHEGVCIFKSALKG